MTVTSPNAAAGTPATVAETLWDGAFGNIEFTGIPGGGAVKDTETAKWTTAGLKDMTCSAAYTTG